jgi:formylmethanofuran dehydrogenase subunit C
MSALLFELKKQPEDRLDLRVLTPDKLKGLSLAEIASLRLGSGQHAPQVADYFDISGENNGFIIFDGDCSRCDYIGASMKSGTIICHGNVGDRLADNMRRGLILVDGDAGNYAASRMIAGTVGIYGKVGDHLGYMMKRGTILLTQTPKLHATMVDCGQHQLGFLPLLLRSFATLETRFKTLQTQPVHKYAGDVGVNGKSEILLFSQT